MTDFNLLPFADHETKVPVEALAPSLEPEKWQSLKFLATHLMDFWFVTSIATVSALMFNQAMLTMLVTSNLYSAFKSEHIFALSFMMLPLMLFTYFFFSYFMNHGQSPAMSLLKRRVVMESKNFEESAKAALNSTLLCLSHGLSFRWQKEFRASYQGHDYLYLNLIREQQEKGPDLFQMIEEMEAAPAIPEEAMLPQAA